MDVAALPWADLLPFILIGFMAQLIDGSFGMAFGVLSNALLIALGLPPFAAAAAVRSAEGFTSGVSGLAHALQRNVDWSLFARLVVPGILGGLIGAWILIHVRLDIVRPVMLVYLCATGAYLLWRGSRRPHTFRRLRLVGPLAFFGGLVDTSGGGGWGPIVTGNLLAQGATPRVAIGTTSAAEFFVTVTVLAAFIGTLGIGSFTIAALGLLIGGVAAAPIGAYLARRLPVKPVITIAGLLLIAMGFYGLASLVFEPLPILPRF